MRGWAFRNRNRALFGGRGTHAPVWSMEVWVWGVRVALYLLGAHLGNGTGHQKYSQMVQWGMRLCFRVVGQAQWGRLMTVYTHGDFIVLPHWNTRLPAPWPANVLSHSVALSWHGTNQSLPYPNKAKHQVRKRQVSILTLLVWLNLGLKTARTRFETATFRFPDLPVWEAVALVIQPPWVVIYSGGGIEGWF